jgi:hypothetical protein
MPNTPQPDVDFFGADVERSDGNSRALFYEGPTFVDADVPKQKLIPGSTNGATETVMVRRPAPKYIAVKTTAKQSDIGDLTARYKMAREIFRFSKPKDKDEAERRMNLAYHEMQAARFALSLARTPKDQVDQIRNLRGKVALHRGFVAEYAGVK